MQTTYPFDGKAAIDIAESKGHNTLAIGTPSWTKDHKVTLNGKEVETTTKDGFILVAKDYNAGDKLEVTFDLIATTRDMINAENTYPENFRCFYGPLMLGSDNDSISISQNSAITKINDSIYQIGDQKLTPVYHLMSDKVWKKKNYKKQVIF